MRRSILVLARVLAASMVAAWGTLGLGDEGEEAGPKGWALVVGVDTYPAVAEYHCPNASKDARAVAEWLTGTARWPLERVHLLVPGSARKPTLANLEAEVSGWLKPNVRPGDLVFVYFAGQAIGLPDPKGDPAEAWGRPLDFLLPADFRLDRKLETVGWSLDRAMEPFGGGKVRVLCCLDTSTSGRGNGRISRKAPSADRMLKRLTRWPGWSAWIAADNGQAAPDAHPGGVGSPFRDRLLQALGTPQNRNDLTASLADLKADEGLARVRFRTAGYLEPGSTLWTARVDRAVDRGVRPVLQRGHAGPITGLRVRADGGVFLSSSEDSTVRIWGPGNGPEAALQLIRTLSEPIGGVSCLALSPGARRIAAGSDRGDGVWLWDEEGENIPLQLKGDPARLDRPIHSIGFLPDSRAMVTVNQAGQVHIWDLSTGKPRAWFEGDKSVVKGTIAFAVDARSSVAVAALDGLGNIRLLGPDALTRRILAGPGAKLSAVDLSRDGRTLAVGTVSGDCAIYDVSNLDRLSNPVEVVRFAEEPIRHLRLKGAGWLALASDDRFRLLRRSADGKKTRPALELPVNGVRRVLFSDDGRLMAAILKEEDGDFRVRLWRLGDGVEVGEIPLGDEPMGAKAPLELAFSSQGAPILMAGSEDGSIQSWTIDESADRVVARSSPTPADPSQIRSISPSPDARRFVQVCQDGTAFVFDFEDRTSTRLAHRWKSLEYLPDGRLVGTLDVLDGSIAEDRRTLSMGAPVVYDLEKERDPIELGRFLGPVDRDAASLRLDRMVVSIDGKWIAATRGEGADRLEAFLWGSSGGAPATRSAPGQGLDRIRAIALAPSGGDLLICTDRAATLRDDAASGLELSIDDLKLDGPKGRLVDEFTAAAIAPRPVEPRRIALGTKRGGVVLWSPADKETPIRRLQGEFRIRVETLTFTDDGRYLVASGKDKRFLAWELKPSGEAEPIAMEPLPGSRHDGEIRDIRAWPRMAMIATTGDDSTVRFWSLEKRRLIGTIAFSRAGRDEDLAGLKWVAFTPEGRFDCPPGGKELMKLVRQGQPYRLDQASGSPFFDRRLVEQIRTATIPEPTPSEQATPPHLVLSAIGPALEAGTSASRSIALEVQLDDPGLTDLRLYQNEMPVRGLDAFQKTADPRRYRSNVTLRKGKNTFRAVAARGGTIEGSSEALPIQFNGPETPSRVHVLAIGIDDYAKESLKLKFAVRDAEDVGGRLVALDALENGQAPGTLPILLLTNEKVNDRAVKLAFEALRKQVEDRPNDKVVIFLAGHTEQFGEDFGLLLSRPQPGSGSLLKYSAILQGLAQLDAQQRLVIVDACQTDKLMAGGRAADFARRERWAIKRDLLKFPTQYILASKAGEPVLENEELQHGLLTYTLLCGLGQARVPSRLEGVPGKDEPFSRPADEDNDGTITTDELNRYASTRLPILLAAYPDSQKARGKVEEDQALANRRREKPLDVSLDPSNNPFVLVKLPRPGL